MRLILMLFLSMAFAGPGYAEPPKGEGGAAVTPSVNAAEAGDAAARAVLVTELAQPPYTQEREQQAGYWLRRMVIDGQEKEVLEIWGHILALRAEIARQHGFKAPADGGSVGIKMFSDAGSNAEDAVTVLIREAELLNVDAQLFLEALYERGAKDFSSHDARVLRYFERMARQELPRARFFVGKVLLYGLGVEANRQAGQDLLLLSGISSGMLELARYSMWLKDHNQAASWWLRAGEEFNSSEAWYNLGLKSQSDGRGALAKRYFERAMDADPDYHAPRLELARMYASGELIMGDARKAFQLMEQVAMRATGPEKFVAIANLGIYYQRGIGVAPDPEQARLHLEAALANGVEGARAYLE